MNVAPNRLPLLLWLVRQQSRHIYPPRCLADLKADKCRGVVSLESDGVWPQAPVVTKTVYDGSNPYADFNASGSLTMRYLNGLGLDSLIARITAGGSTPDWYLTDQQGSVRQIVGADGTVKDALVYDAFGNVSETINPSYPTSGDRFGFAGSQLAKLISGNINLMGARWYDPTTGRFLSKDPIGFNAGDANLTRYVGNEPVSHTDPTGTGGILDIFKEIFGGFADFITGNGGHLVSRVASDLGYSDNIVVKVLSGAGDYGTGNGLSVLAEIASALGFSNNIVFKALFLYMEAGAAEQYGESNFSGVFSGGADLIGGIFGGIFGGISGGMDFTGNLFGAFSGDLFGSKGTSFSSEITQSSQSLSDNGQVVSQAQKRQASVFYFTPFELSSASTSSANSLAFSLASFGLNSWNQASYNPFSFGNSSASSQGFNLDVPYEPVVGNAVTNTGKGQGTSSGGFWSNVGSWFKEDVIGPYANLFSTNPTLVGVTSFPSQVASTFMSGAAWDSAQGAMSKAGDLLTLGYTSPSEIEPLYGHTEAWNNAKPLGLPIAVGVGGAGSLELLSLVPTGAKLEAVIGAGAIFAQTQVPKLPSLASSLSPSITEMAPQWYLDWQQMMTKLIH